MGWFLITIALPLVAPIVAVLFFRPFTLPAAAAANAHLMVPVKDGQLGWISLSFCASAIYELRTGRATLPGYDWYLFGFIFILFWSSVLAAGGAIQPVPYPKPAGVKWWRHFKLFTWSLAPVVISVAGFLAVHLQGTAEGK